MYLTRKISLFLSSLVFLVVLTIGFLVGRLFSLQVPREIFIPISCFVIVVWAYLFSESANIPFILMGVNLGFILNVFLSVDFLANPSFLSVFVELASVLLALFVIFWKARKSDMYKKFRYLFLGVSFISFLFVFGTFVSLVQDYLPLYPYEEGGGVVLHFRYSIVVNVVKSLFLTGLFSLSERIARIIEETP